MRTFNVWTGEFLEMADDSDYIVDIEGQAIDDGKDREVRRTARPFICVHFECCDVYNRIYRRKDATAYVGWCPKCARKVTVRVGPNGINARFFRAR